MNESLLASEKGIRSGDYVLLYCAPEAIVDSEHWSDHFTQEPFCSQVVEAHCVYKWGAKFCPSYARIHELRSVLPAEYQLVHVTPERSNIFIE